MLLPSCRDDNGHCRLCAATQRRLRDCGTTHCSRTRGGSTLSARSRGVSGRSRGPVDDQSGLGVDSGSATSGVGVMYWLYGSSASHDLERASKSLAVTLPLEMPVERVSASVTIFEYLGGSLSALAIDGIDSPGTS